ncbi:IS110 family transposase [Wolbachia pipientis]|uniref:hypothetical protein n=1 Tax=Wolbachia pipientis TaxID=955 RepID=UPI0015F81EE6|nr:hypothetical protein [Wolbachia pipientis]MBA8766527.1 IS110 family transposase [Wolbachia pipientis]MBA8767212.1 IS110 family transposase [Wolbachia pipientis]
MQVNAILGVDISKKKFDVCLLVDSKKRHKVFQNNQDGFAKLVFGAMAMEQILLIYVLKQLVGMEKIWLLLCTI